MIDDVSMIEDDAEGGGFAGSFSVMGIRLDSFSEVGLTTTLDLHFSQYLWRR